MPTLLIESGVALLTLRKGDGLRVDLATGEVHVFRDDDAPALLRGKVAAKVEWRDTAARADLLAIADYLEFDGSMSEGDAARRVALLRRIAGAAAMEAPSKSKCEHCDDLGWEWEHGLGGESWMVVCHRHCAAAEKWLADEHGVKEAPDA